MKHIRISDYIGIKKGKVASHMGRMENLNWISLLVGIALIIGSIFALANPNGTFMVLTIMLGIVAIVRGLMLIFNYYRIKDLTSFKAKYNLVIGILLVIVGIVFLFKPNLASDVFGYILAVWFIVDGINNLIRSSLLKYMGNGLFAFSVIMNILLLIGGIILIFRPMLAGISVSIIIGISMMISGIEYVTFAFFDSKTSA